MMIPNPEDTIVALSSALGPARRAIIRIGGPEAVAVTLTVFTPTHHGLSESPRRTIPGEIRLSEVTSPIPAEAYYFRAPASYTGQDLVELHMISSPPLVERLIADLLSHGARGAQPGEFTLRAFLSGKKDLTRAEAVRAVIEAGSDDELQEALAQLAGGIARPLEELRNDLLNLLADVEAGLDFVDEDIEFVSQVELLTRLAAGMAQLQNLKRQLSDRTVSGRPLRIVLAGAPNAGKSSLFNALVGSPDAALVSSEAGTTRDYLIRLISIDGVPVELTDTAGWQEARDTIESQSQQLGKEQTSQADLVLCCLPADEPVPEPLPRLGSMTHLYLQTKSDLAEIATDLIPVSLVTPEGLKQLQNRLREEVQSLRRSALAPSQSRCRHHVDAALEALRHAHEHVRENDPQELIAFELRQALNQIGEMNGAIYTNDLLDRIFSRFCIGK